MATNPKNVKADDQDYQWSNEICEDIANEDQFPTSVKDIDVQKVIINRFFEHYLGAKTPKGLSVTDLTFSVISIMPLHADTEEFIWDDTHYDDNGALFLVTPESKKESGPASGQGDAAESNAKTDNHDQLLLENKGFNNDDEVENETTSDMKPKQILPNVDEPQNQTYSAVSKNFEKSTTNLNVMHDVIETHNIPFSKNENELMNESKYLRSRYDNSDQPSTENSLEIQLNSNLNKTHELTINKSTPEIYSICFPNASRQEQNSDNESESEIVFPNVNELNEPSYVRYNKELLINDLQFPKDIPDTKVDGNQQHIQSDVTVDIDIDSKIHLDLGVEKRLDVESEIGSAESESTKDNVVNPDDKNVTETKAKKPRLEPTKYVGVYDEYDIKWFQRLEKPNEAPTKISTSAYGPVENAAFITTCHKLFNEWETNPRARIILKYFFGVIALTLMRGVTKSYRHIINTFSSKKYLTIFNQLKEFKDGTFKYSIPHKRCIKSSYGTFKKRNDVTSIMFAKIVINSNNIDDEIEECTALNQSNPYNINVFKFAVLAHTANFGLNLITMLQRLEKFCVLDMLYKETKCDDTIESWRRMKRFIDKYMKNDSEERTHYWASIIDADVFRNICCINNYPLSVIFAVFIESMYDDEDIWKSIWVEKGKDQGLENLKERGFEMLLKYKIHRNKMNHGSNLKESSIKFKPGGNVAQKFQRQISDGTNSSTEEEDY